MSSTPRVAIIGGSGFIGTTLVRRLIEHGSDVTIVDKRVSQSFPDLTRTADVRSLDQLQSALRESTPDVIVNLAAEHKDNVRPVSLYHEVNVDGARHVCAVAEAAGVNRIVFTSSVAVYGFAEPETDESGSIRPFNHYGITKSKAEEVYRAWRARAPEDRSLVIVRPTVVFGPQNRGNVYNLLRQIAARRFIMVGRGTNRKSMAYVDNVAAFIEYAFGFPTGEHVYNYVDKPDLSMNDLVKVVTRELGYSGRSSFRVPYPLAYAGAWVLDVVAAVTGREFNVSAIRMKKFTATTQFESSIPEQTDFRPPVSMLEGLSRTIEYEFLREPRHDDEVFETE